MDLLRNVVTLTSSTETLRWDGSATNVVVPETIARTAGVRLLDTSIGRARVKRVLDPHETVLDREMTPSGAELAE